MYTVHNSPQCGAWPVACTLYNIQRTQYTMYNVHNSPHCGAWPVACTLYTIKCTLYAMYYTLYKTHLVVVHGTQPVHCTPYNVHGTLCTLCTTHLIVVHCLQPEPAVLALLHKAPGHEPPRHFPVAVLNPPKKNDYSEKYVIRALRVHLDLYSIVTGVYEGQIIFAIQTDIKVIQCFKLSIYVCFTSGT